MPLLQSCLSFNLNNDLDEVNQLIEKTNERDKLDAKRQKIFQLTYGKVNMSLMPNQEIMLNRLIRLRMSFVRADTARFFVGPEFLACIVVSVVTH